MRSKIAVAVEQQPVKPGAGARVTECAQPADPEAGRADAGHGAQVPAFFVGDPGGEQLPGGFFSEDLLPSPGERLIREAFPPRSSQCRFAQAGSRVVPRPDFLAHRMSPDSQPR